MKILFFACGYEDEREFPDNTPDGDIDDAFLDWVKSDVVGWERVHDDAATV
ncbi:MAG: hypothetical protein WBQ94_03655 [Terracidiphilus sp.]